MDWISFRRPRRKAALVAVSVGVVLAVTACGGGDSDDGASASEGGLPDTIKLVSVNPTTGVVAFAGSSANKGYELAIKEINESDLLGGAQIELEFADTKSEPQAAAQETSAAIADKDVSAIFGSVSSGEAIAMSPLLQEQGLPVVYTQAGSEGVVVGDFTYRATPLMSSYYPLVEQWLTEGGFESMGIMYTQLTPTLVEVGSETLPTIAGDLGIELTSEIAIPATTQDYAAPISQVLDKDPDLVSALLVGASNVTVMTQLRQAGYDGPVLGNSGASAGNLEPAGEDGAGMVWPADFNYQQTAASSQAFVEAYNAEFGEDPLNYAAEAYDAAYFLARSIAAADSADRTEIKDAMALEADKSMDGALGEGLTWTDQTINVPGVMIEWDGTGEVLLYEAEAE